MGLPDEKNSDRRDRIDLTWTHGSHPFPPFGEDLAEVLGQRDGATNVLTVLSHRQIVISRTVACFWNIQDFSFRFNYLLVKATEILENGIKHGSFEGTDESSGGDINSNGGGGIQEKAPFTQAQAVETLSKKFDTMHCQDTLRRMLVHITTMKQLKVQIFEVFRREETAEFREKRQELVNMITKLELYIVEVNIAFDSMERCINGHFKDCTVIEISHYSVDANINSAGVVQTREQGTNPTSIKWTFMSRSAFIAVSITCLIVFALLLKGVQSSIERKAKKMK